MVTMAWRGTKFIWRVALVLMLYSTLSARSAHAQQAGGCDPDSGDTYHYLLSRYTAIATDSDIADTRATLGIPLLSPNQIGFVADSVVCHQASSAYTAAEGDSAVGRLVYVFRLGNLYLVVDKQVLAGEFLIGWMFDSTFTPLKRISA